MESTKPWYFSKGVIGPVAALVSFIGTQLGWWDADAATIEGWIVQGVQIVGVILGLFGRVVADKKITLT